MKTIGWMLVVGSTFLLLIGDELVGVALVSAFIGITLLGRANLKGGLKDGD